MPVVEKDMTKQRLEKHAHVCPVCGMDASTVGLPEIIYNGRTYFFCTPYCLDVFEQSPDIYLSMNTELVYERSRELELVRKETLECLSRAAEFKDNETAMHIRRIGSYSHRLAIIAGLGSQYAVCIRETSPMHDIGKIGVPESILLKPGTLNKEERSIIEQHPEMGARILGKDLNSDTMKMASTIALSHHERWNGTGYPYGLDGNNIPIEGRIVALCDVFDALISDRPYKSAWPIGKIQSLIASEEGKHFDPKLTQLFLHHFFEFVEIYNQLRDINCEESS